MPIKVSSKTAKKEFMDRLARLSGQNVHQCFQCGTCAGSCPMMEHLDASPRRIMHMAQLGLEEEIKDANTCWMCASCHNCEVRCPRGVDIPKVMEALRQMKLRENEDFLKPGDLEKELIKECPQIAMVAGFRKFTA